MKMKMLRNTLKAGSVANLFTISNWFDYDNLTNETETEKKADTSIAKNETGWDRVQRMFTLNEFGEPSDEIITMSHVGAMSCFVGCVYGGVIHSRVAYMNFIKNNQATTFTDHLEAKKKLQEQVMLAFGKGAFKWAWRLSLFCTTFVGISTTISVYRGETGIAEYAAAGLISGSLYKFNLGPRGWIVGGGLGLTLGIIAGCATYGLLKLTGMSMEEVRYWQYHWEKSRRDYVNKGMAAYLEKEEHEAVRLHNRKLGEGGKNLDNVE